MAGIFIRTYPSGRVVWRVMFKRIRPSFSLAFESREQAVEWAYAHEKSYQEDPDFYFNWRRELYYQMQKQNIDVSEQGILLPSPKRFFLDTPIRKN